jgi:uncharacterized protein
MGERTQYTPGTFSWTDLSTTDQEAAKTFYTSLFGWEVQDNPVDDETVYSMMLIDGKPVAAISPQPQQQRDAGVPPVWNSYITVEKVDDSAERVTRLGGTVHAPPFDVMDVGRMAVVQDPGQAWFLLWEPKAHIGAHIVNRPGALSWNELATRDMDASAGFYAELFGWTSEPMEGGGMPYLVIKNRSGHANGGIRPVMPPDAPPHWLVYFGSADAGSDLAKVSELGGTTLVEPTSIGPGTIAVAQDPQGAVFALYSGQFDD